MKVAIIGAGHGGCAAGAILARKGHDVTLYKMSASIHNENFEALHAAGGIYLEGIKGSGFYKLKASDRHSIDQIAACDVLLVHYVSNFHETVCREIAPHLKDNQLVVFNPGYLGTYALYREMQRIGNTAKVSFAEFETLAFSSRITRPGHVKIYSENVKHPFAMWPGVPSEEQWKLLEEIVGSCVLRESVLEVALHNPNLIIHTVGVLLNASKVEDPSKGFALYRDGFSPAVWKVVRELDKEKMNALTSLGYPARTYFEEFQVRTFGKVGMDDLEAFNHYASEAPNGPFSINHRYITEDVPYGLGLLQTIGEIQAFPTPMTDALIALAVAMLPEVPIAAYLREMKKRTHQYIAECVPQLTSYVATTRKGSEATWQARSTSSGASSR